MEKFYSDAIFVVFEKIVLVWFTRLKENARNGRIPWMNIVFVAVVVLYFWDFAHAKLSQSKVFVERSDPGSKSLQTHRHHP